HCPVGHLRTVALVRSLDRPGFRSGAHVPHRGAGHRGGRTESRAGLWRHGQLWPRSVSGPRCLQRSHPCLSRVGQRHAPPSDRPYCLRHYWARDGRHRAAHPGDRLHHDHAGICADVLLCLREPQPLRRGRRLAARLRQPAAWGELGRHGPAIHPVTGGAVWRTVWHPASHGIALSQGSAWQPDPRTAHAGGRGAPGRLYTVSLVLLFGALYGTRRLTESRFGMVLRGSRINEQRMRALGFPTARYRLAAYVMSAMLCGVAGVLYANLTQFAAPSYMSWAMSGELIVMVVLGGMGSVLGPLYGAAAMLLTEEVLKSITEHWMIVFGPAIVA